MRESPLFISRGSLQVLCPCALPCARLGDVSKLLECHYWPPRGTAGLAQSPHFITSVYWLQWKQGAPGQAGCTDFNSFHEFSLACAVQGWWTAPCRSLCSEMWAPCSFFNNPQAVPSPQALSLGCSQCCCISSMWLREDRARHSLCWGSQSLFCLILENSCGKGIWWIADIWVTFFHPCCKVDEFQATANTVWGFQTGNNWHEQVQNANGHMAGKVCALDWEIWGRRKASAGFWPCKERQNTWSPTSVCRARPTLKRSLSGSPFGEFDRIQHYGTERRMWVAGLSHNVILVPAAIESSVQCFLFLVMSLSLLNSKRSTT